MIYRWAHVRLFVYMLSRTNQHLVPNFLGNSQARWYLERKTLRLCSKDASPNIDSSDLVRTLITCMGIVLLWYQKGTPKAAQNNLLDSFLTITSTKTDLENTSYRLSIWIRSRLDIRVEVLLVLERAEYHSLWAALMVYLGPWLQVQGLAVHLLALVTPVRPRSTYIRGRCSGGSLVLEGRKKQDRHDIVEGSHSWQSIQEGEYEWTLFLDIIVSERECSPYELEFRAF